MLSKESQTHGAALHPRFNIFRPCAHTGHPSFQLLITIKQGPNITCRTWLTLSTQRRIIGRLAREVEKSVLGKMVRLCNLKVLLDVCFEHESWQGP